MRKIILTIIMSFMFIGSVNAEIKADNLEETIEQKIESFESYDSLTSQIDYLKNLDLSNYENDEDKVNVYLFRGETCIYCFYAVEFLASLTEEMGDKFNVISYEVYHNEDNFELLKRVSDHLGESVSSVPYMVIGNESFHGYSSSLDEEIKNLINSEFDKHVDVRVDVAKELNFEKTNIDEITPGEKTDDSDVSTSQDDFSDEDEESDEINYTIVAIVIAGLVVLFFLNNIKSSQK